MPEDVAVEDHHAKGGDRPPGPAAAVGQGGEPTTLPRTCRSLAADPVPYDRLPTEVATVMRRALTCPVRCTSRFFESSYWSIVNVPQ